MKSIQCLRFISSNPWSSLHLFRSCTFSFIFFSPLFMLYAHSIFTVRPAAGNGVAVAVVVVVCFIFCSFSFICFNLFHFRTFSRVLLFLSSFYLFSIVSCRVILFFSSLYSFFLSLYFVSCLVFSVSSVTYGSTSSSSYCTLNKYFASGWTNNSVLVKYTHTHTYTPTNSHRFQRILAWMRFESFFVA